jgi:hypothetical protein
MTWGWMLEQLDFGVDLRSRTLIGNPAHGGEHVFRFYGRGAITVAVLGILPNHFLARCRKQDVRFSNSRIGVRGDGST